MKKNTMLEHLGIEFTRLGPDFIEATMPVDHRTHQPDGLLHGGASVTLAETLGSVAAWLCVDDPKRQNVVGIEINANHLSTAKSGEVVARVTPVKVGRRIQVWDIIIRQADRKICTSRLTTMTVAVQK